MKGGSKGVHLAQPVGARRDFLAGGGGAGGPARAKTYSVNVAREDPVHARAVEQRLQRLPLRLAVALVRAVGVVPRRVRVD